MKKEEYKLYSSMIMETKRRAYIKIITTYDKKTKQNYQTQFKET